jgi:Bardet-Biedl syndrome 5 protein
MYNYWQDYDVRFDVHIRSVHQLRQVKSKITISLDSQLQMAPGEVTLERVEPVEDTKGNSGDRGCLLMTNLRIIWYSIKSPKLNLSKYFII